MKNQKNRSMKVYSQNGRNYKATPTIINGNIRKIDKTNLTYIEPNRIIIKDKNSY